MEEILKHFDYEIAEFIKPYYGSPIIDEVIELKINIRDWLISRKQSINDYYWTRKKEDKLSISYSYKSFKVRFTFLPNCEFYISIDHSTSRITKIEDKKVRDNFYADPGYIYFIESEYGWKIGKTRDLDKRKSVFEVKLPFKFSLKYYVKCHDITKMEIYFHNYFKSKHINGEWYLITFEDILKCVAETDYKLRRYTRKEVEFERKYLAKMYTVI